VRAPVNASLLVVLQFPAKAERQPVEHLLTEMFQACTQGLWGGTEGVTGT